MRIWAPQGMEIMGLAREKASAMGHAELDPLHLLWAFLREAALAGQPQVGAGVEPIMAIHRTEQELAGLPVAHTTVIASPNSRLRDLFLRAADLAAVTNDRNDEGRIGPHELVLALVGDRGPAGELLHEFKVKAVQMAG